MAMVTIEVEFDNAGKAVIRLPSGRSLSVDPAKIAEITEQLAKGMGPILERHKAHTHIHLDTKGKMVEQVREGE